MLEDQADWPALYRRLERARLVLEAAAAPNPEREREIFRARARALARVPDEAPAGPSLEVLPFELAGETYAVETAFVREVVSLRDYTPVPGVPVFVLGVVNVRGEMLSVLDLRRFFELPIRGLNELNKVVVLRGHGMEFGLLADAVQSARTLQLQAVQPPLPTLTGIRAALARGLTATGMILLEAARLLQDRRLIVETNSSLP